jgi:hypothetical protein
VLTKHRVRGPGETVKEGIDQRVLVRRVAEDDECVASEVAGVAFGDVPASEAVQEVGVGGLQYPDGRHVGSG